MPEDELRRIWANASRSMLSTISSPWPSVRSPSAIPCHFPSEKKPVSEMTSALTASGWSQAHRSPISPPQSWTTSTTRSSPSSCRNASTPSTCRCPRPGRVGRRVPEAGEVGRDRAVALGRHGGQRVPPHVGRLRIPVQHERHGPVLRPVLAVVQHGGEPTQLATSPRYARSELAKLIERQHGRVARRQLFAAGLSQRQIDRAAARPGGCARVHRGVYAIAGTPATREAPLDGRGPRGGRPGAALSHRSAAELWGLLPGCSSPVHVTVPGAGGRARRRGWSIHRARRRPRSTAASR